MAKANRYRNDSSADPAELFAADQSLGPFFEAIAAQLVDSGKSLVLTDKTGTELLLATESEWKCFFSQYLKTPSPLETDRAWAERLYQHLGIPFGSFVRLIEDMAAVADGNCLFRLTNGSKVAELLRLYERDETYAVPLESLREDALILNEDEPWSAPIEPGSKINFEVEIDPAIYPRFIMAAPEMVFGRDRDEVEGHADFEPSDTAWELFPKHATVHAWIPLDLEELPDRFWENAASMDLVGLYNWPLHLEKDPEEDTGYHFNREDFLDAYLDSESGVLSTQSLSVRARLRHEQMRGLVQIRADKGTSVETGRIVREEWERRIQQGYFGDDLPSMQRLVEIAQYGWVGGGPMPELRKLLKRLVDSGAHNPSRFLRLRPDHLVFQERRRTNLQIDTIDVVRERLRKAREYAAAQDPLPTALRVFIEKVAAQLTAMESARDVLARYGFRRMIAGEAILISQDKWCAYEPGAYARDEWPQTFDGKGLRGRGIRLEAELDQNSSDQLQITLTALDEEIKKGTGDLDALKRDRETIRVLQNGLFNDVSTTVAIQKGRLLGAGLVEIQGMPYSKSTAAQEMIASGQGGFRRGHRYWI